MTEPTLAERLLAKPTAPVLRGRPTRGALTSEVDVTGDVATATVNTKHAEPEVLEGQARDVLEEAGLDPAEWLVTSFRASRWTPPGKPDEEGVSARFTFGRRGTAAAPEAVERPNISEIVDRTRKARPVTAVKGGPHGFILALGDTQFGKIDGDGVEGTVARTFSAISAAADLYQDLRLRFDFGQIHIAFLGDHIEGFVSQGGANVWRTPLSLSEQIRLTRQMMLHALEEFAGFGVPMSMAAVPGNHDQAVRIAGKGVTRYDDSHDTEALIAVSEAARMNPAAFGHVEFFVPQTDEMTVVLDVAGTRVAHVHGHQYRPGKHFDWWEGQAFGGSPLRDADLLLAGHLHHLHVDTKGPRTYIGTPALESESTWYRHATGTTGSPGAVVAVTRDGLTSPLEVVR